MPHRDQQEVAVDADALLERVRASSKLPAPRQRRAIRERAGVSQRDVAQALGVGVMVLNRWERGLSEPKVHAAAYARLLDELRRITAGGDAD
jgi:DNA-binding transcriptional regulator YiaG